MEFITEFTRSQIASLVLGYLKSEKCNKAFNEFLEESPFFQKNKQNIKRGKYFVTRVAGLCLVDLLEEYAAIYSIVQGRLEASNYFNEVHTKGTLVDQILYLFEKDGEVIRNSTPFRYSRSPSPPSLSAKQRKSSETSEVDATPVDDLPGNGVEESDSHAKTPKKKGSRSRSTNSKNLDKDEAFDVSEVLTQTLLENHELHEKIAETINIVRNTPEGSKPVLDEHISAGASKELDAIIKTVVQRTEEDPLYNKLIDEIIGTAPFDNPPAKKANASLNTPHILESKRHSEKIENQSTPTNRIEDHNDDAVRSIIEAAQSTDIPPPQNNGTTKSENGEVYVFEGTLDTYLKSSGGNPMPPNPVYINTGGLIVMPPETSSKQFYIVNNQPLINMNVSAVKGMISDNDIMAMPTIIVNDETQTTFTNQNCTPVTKNPPNKRNKTIKIAPKADKLEKKVLSEFLNLDNHQPEKKKIKTNKSEAIKTVPAVVTALQATPSTVVTTPSVVTAPSPRTTSHVRNLDFSTPPPQKGVVEVQANNKKGEEGRTWDADLRSLIAANCVDKCPTPKRKRTVTSRPKKKTTKTKNKFEEKLEDKKEEEESEEAKETVVVEPETIEEEEEHVKEDLILATPIKDDVLPKTPGGEIITAKTPGGEIVPTNNNLPCTPFTAVLEEQLRGVDLISLPTPKIPITPGFALNLTPADVPPYNRSTDYSTSSSYYQPSDTEQNKSLDQLIEECRKLENKSPPPPEQIPSTKMKIISDVVIEPAKITKTVEKKKNCDEHLKKFNHSVIGKKNLSLLKPTSSSSSSDSDSSDTESEKSEEHNTNNTIISKEMGDKTVKKSDVVAINDIISTIEVKKTLDEETKKKNLLSQLEEVRKRTVQIIKNPPQLAKKTTRNNKKSTVKRTAKPEVRKKKNVKKKESSVEESNTDEEAQKLVKGLWQRGIHLVPKKTPKKKIAKLEEPPRIPPPPPLPPSPDKQSDDSSVIFDTRVYDGFEVITYDEKVGKRKSLENYNFEVLKKGFEATVFAEHLQEEVTRTMRWTSFESLADIPTKISVSSPLKSKGIEEDMENDLMDYVIVGSVREESPETKLSSRGGKKRKSRLSEDDNKQVEKKSKAYEHNIKLLKKIDVDVFLDKVHGE